MGNSLKTIYARITTNSSATTALDSIGITLEKASGEAKSSAELIDEVAKKWDTLSESQKRNTAVGISGIYQLSRFNALMLNYDTAISATETSVNSYNSAMREQEKYNQSLEARLNNLSNAWMDFSNAMGQTVVYDTVVVLTSALEALGKGGADSVSSIASLSAMIGLLAAPVSLVSSRFTTFGTNLIQTTAQKKVATVATGTYTAKLWGLVAGANAASGAIRTLLLATGVGAAIAVVTAGISVLINKLSEAKQKAEEFEQYLKSNTSALTDNKEQVDKLLNSYYKMSESNKEVWSTEQQQEYIDIQNQLAELFPSIIDHVDANGNAHIKTKDAIALEIEETNKLIEAEKELQRLQAQDTFKDVLKESKGTKGQIEGLEATLKLKVDRGSSSEEIAKLKLDILKLEKELSNNSLEIRDSVLDIADAFTEAGTSISSTIDTHIVDALGSIDFSKLNEKELESLSKSLAGVRVELQNAFTSGNTEAMNLANQKLIDLVTSSKGLKPELENVIVSTDRLTASMNESANSAGLVGDEFSDTGDITDELAKKISDLQESLIELKTTEEQLTGTSYNHVKSSEELIFMYDTLTSRLNGLSDQELQAILSKQNLSSEEKLLVQAMHQRGDVISQLSVLYPQYAKLQEGAISLSSQQVDAMQQEEKANKVLLEAYKLMSEGKLNSMQITSVNQASTTKSTIANIKAEIEALNLLIKQYENVANASLSSKQFIDKIQNGEYQAHSSSFVLPDPTSQVKKQIGNLEIDLNSYGSTLDGLISSIDTFSNKINETGGKSSKSAKESTKNTKESIYVSDKYKQALEKINLEIEKQESLRENFPKHSEEYRKSLLAQIKLEKEKLDLIKSQQAELNKQIKSGNIKQTGIVDVTPSSTTKTTSASKNINGWSGAITSGFEMRMHPTLRVMKMHEGIDIAGKKGTRLDSNVNGKVISQGYNSTSGNFVKIEDTNGFKHFYAHLDKAFAKVGDLVEAGTQIGTIGSTGNSTGSHLHYGVQDKNGKYIDPSTYVKSAKNNKVVTSNTSSGEKSASQIKAEKQQALDQAKSEAIAYEQQVIAQQKKLDNLEKVLLVESELAKFDYKRSQYDSSIAYESTKIEELDTSSARYTATLDNMIKYMNKKQNMNQQELKYLQSSINSGKYQGDVLENLKTRYAALTTEMKATQIEIKKTNYEILMNIKTQSDELIGNVEYQMSRAKAIQGLYDEGSGDWVELAEEEIVLQKELTNLYKIQYEQLQKDITARALDADGIKKANKELQNLSVAYWNSLSAEKAMTKSLEDSQKNILSGMADDIINAYKEVYSEKQDIHMESLESERKAEEKAHQARMKQIEDEMKLYRKSVQEKIDLINKQESERDYNMEISEMETERSSVAKKLNEVQFDNSHEGKAERKKLQEQLDKIDKDIAEKRHSRDIQLQTDALNEMLELKEEESQGVQEIETARYETVISNIDRQKEYWGKYYNDIINDERKFAKLREDIMSKNFDNIEKEFGGFIDELNATLPSLGDTMDGTMGAVGTSIRVNIIDNLKRALDMLAEFESKQSITKSHATMGSGSVSSPTGSSTKSLSNGNKQVLLGKYMTEILAGEEKDLTRRANIKSKAHEIAASGRSAGATIGANESFASALSKLEKNELMELADYFESRSNVVSQLDRQGTIKTYVQQLLARAASMSTGGMIPRATGGIDGKGGRGIIVHPNEIVSNPIDSKNMVVASSIMERVASMISLPKLNSLFSPSNGGNGVEINFNIDKMYGTEQDANGILSKVNTVMKTRFGGGL